MRRLGWGLALLAAAGAGLLLWRLRRFPDPPRTRLAIRVSGDAAPGLQALLQDLAESQGRWVVVPAEAPAPQLHLRARREGSNLTLTGDLDGAPLPPCAGTPAEALAALAGRLGLRPPGPTLLPGAPDRAWDLLDLAGRSQDETSRDLLRRAEALVAAEPRCAEARLALATLETRFLVERVDADT
ncbi:MAG TPA: hypothetical protein VFT46_09065, partial [Holophagaceae bacterium]|nr:hypothetical protein [Holophagaceae bacterium]